MNVSADFTKDLLNKTLIFSFVPNEEFDLRYYNSTESSVSFDV
jgi:hypothetical protein